MFIYIVVAALVLTVAALSAKVYELAISKDLLMEDISRVFSKLNEIKTSLQLTDTQVANIAKSSSAQANEIVHLKGTIKTQGEALLAEIRAVEPKITSSEIQQVIKTPNRKAKQANVKPKSK